MNYSASFASTLKQHRDMEHSTGLLRQTGGAMLVGEISRSRQTVSELLIQNPELRNSTWDILSSPVNRNREYTRLVPGTKVYYNPQDGSLSWSKGSGMAAGESRADAVVATVLPVVPVSVATVECVMEKTGQDATAGATELGVISRQTPTVSHLLKTHPQFGADTWDILSLAANANKDFSRLPVGTKVVIDPATREISWRAGSAETWAVPEQPAGRQIVAEAAKIVYSAAAPSAPEQNQSVPTNGAMDLTEAVRPFFGRNYKEINCYELLVKGLERMNIPYSGKNGLFSKLTSMAKEQGLPANAYLNGEGVVKAAGSLVLSRNYPHTVNWKRDAEKLYEDMAPLLDKGQILSFSTRHRGHTGIVGQQDSQWTFINSGRLDNSLTKNSPRQGVGEELLQQEIRNWFRLASKSGESLSVTLGTVGRERAVAAALGTEQSSTLSRRI